MKHSRGNKASTLAPKVYGNGSSFQTIKNLVAIAVGIEGMMDIFEAKGVSVASESRQPWPRAAEIPYSWGRVKGGCPNT